MAGRTNEGDYKYPLDTAMGIMRVSLGEGDTHIGGVEITHPRALVAGLQALHQSTTPEELIAKVYAQRRTIFRGMIDTRCIEMLWMLEGSPLRDSPDSLKLSRYI